MLVWALAVLKLVPGAYRTRVYICVCVCVWGGGAEEDGGGWVGSLSAAMLCCAKGGTSGTWCGGRWAAVLMWALAGLKLVPGAKREGR